MHCTLCSMIYALCSMLYDMCYVFFALQFLFCTLCYIIYALSFMFYCHTGAHLAVSTWVEILLVLSMQVFRIEKSGVWFRMHIFHDSESPSKLHTKKWWQYCLYFSLPSSCLTRKSSSPPSAHVVAMRSVQQQNCKTKLYWNCFETTLKVLLIFLKHTLSLNTLETFIKCVWNCLETSLKHHLNFFKILLNLPWITLEGLSEHPSIFLETPLKLPWNILETPCKLPSNTHSTSFKYSWNPLKSPSKTLKSSLKDPRNFL